MIRRERREVNDMIRRIMSGEELVVGDPRLVRYLARMLGRQRRQRVHIGRDARHRVTKISLL